MQGGRQVRHPTTHCGSWQQAAAFAGAHLAHGALRGGGQHAEQEPHLIREAELGAGVWHVLHQAVAHGRREEQHLQCGTWGAGWQEGGGRVGKGAGGMVA